MRLQDENSLAQAALTYRMSDQRINEHLQLNNEKNDVRGEKVIEGQFLDNVIGYLAVLLELWAEIRPFSTGFVQS